MIYCKIRSILGFVDSTFTLTIHVLSWSAHSVPNRSNISGTREWEPVLAPFSLEIMPFSEAGLESSDINRRITINLSKMTREMSSFESGANVSMAVMSHVT